MAEDPFNQYWHEHFQHYATLHIPDYEKSLYFKPDTIKRYKLFLKIINSLDIKNLLILDAGCGTGMYSKELLKNGNKIVGIDKSDNILKVAKKKDKENKMSLIYGDLYNLPFKNEIFDLTLCVGVYQHITDYKKMTNELFQLRTTKSSFSGLNNLLNSEFSRWRTKDWYIMAGIWIAVINFGIFSMTSYAETTVREGLMMMGFFASR